MITLITRCWGRNFQIRQTVIYLKCTKARTTARGRSKSISGVSRGWEGIGLRHPVYLESPIQLRQDTNNAIGSDNNFVLLYHYRIGENNYCIRKYMN